MSHFDYNAPAELFPAKVRTGRRRVNYRRFDTAAQAIRFAIEELPANSISPITRTTQLAFSLPRECLSLPLGR
jgi:hypothetical protein